MRLFPKELEIAPGEGFTNEKDIFGRAAFGQQLTSIVARVDAPLVIVLDAPWGEGKTTFIKMWAGELKKRNIPSIYFDAFANDYQENAFIALSSHIIDELNDSAAPSSTKFKKFSATAFKVAKVLGKAGLQAGVKIMSAGIIETEALKGTATEVVNAIRDETEKSLDDLLKERLESHRSDKEAFAEFRRSLTGLSEIITSDLADNSIDLPDGTFNNAQEDKGGKVVFIIDELDRCKPSFALSILENIKHLFSVNSIHFVLVTNLSQLHSAIKFAYGDIDARSYLEKFYHLRMQLPAGDIARQDLRVITFCKFLGLQNEVAELLYTYDKINHLSLRTIERITTYFQIIQISVKQNQFNLYLFSITLCILKVMHPDEYNLARESRLRFSEFTKCMGLDQWKERHSPEAPS